MSQEEPADPTPTHWYQKVSSRQVRWAGIFALALAIAVVAVQEAVAREPWLRSCSTELANVGTVAAVEVCRSVAVTDPAFLSPLLVILLLLIPDVTRIGVAGVIELERTVSEQRVRTESLETRVTHLSAIISQQQHSHQTVNVTMNQSNDVLEPGADLSDLTARIEEREQRFRSGTHDAD